jgi:putative tryptophan/tyrosine transport system substrate-binding protein
VELEILEVRSTANLDGAILDAGQKGVDALLMLSSPVFGSNPQRIAGLTLGLRMPAVSLFPEFARAGGLMAYGVDPVSSHRQGGALVAKLLRGAKPAEVPAELPTKFELVVNQKTAKLLGITLPTGILLRADEVIERLLAQSGVSLRCQWLVALGAEADIALASQLRHWLPNLL